MNQNEDNQKEKKEKLIFDSSLCSIRYIKLW